jgi:N-acetylmuramoyl-L-alanine amidase
MEIRDHRLEDERIQYRESPNRGGPFAAGCLDTIVVHYTAGANAESAIHTLSDPEREVSAHLVVARDGSVVQLVPFDRVAWHAGRSRWGGRESFNQYSIGIEIDNAGQLEYRDGRYVSWFGREYPESEVVWGVHRNQTQATPWHRYPRAQLRVVERLCQVLIAEYGIRHILGHEEIAPDRKVDPGPAFPLDALRGRLLYGPAFALAAVRAGRADLFAAPGGGTERMAGLLGPGTEVRILEEKEGWCRVAVELEGWISARHLDPAGRGNQD